MLGCNILSIKSMNNVSNYIVTVQLNIFLKTDDAYVQYHM